MTEAELKKFTSSSQSAYGNECVLCRRKMSPIDNPSEWHYNKTSRSVIFICDECLHKGKFNNE